MPALVTRTSFGRVTWMVSLPAIVKSKVLEEVPSENLVRVSAPAEGIVPMLDKKRDMINISTIEPLPMPVLTLGRLGPMTLVLDL